MVGLLHPYLGMEDFWLLELRKRKRVNQKRAYLGKVDRHAGLLHNSSVFYWHSELLFLAIAFVELKDKMRDAICRLEERELFKGAR